MSEIKLVLADIDGTLVPLLEGTPSQAVIDSISKVQQKGVLVAPVTGRPYGFAKSLFSHVDFQDYGVFDAGATVRSVHTGDAVWKNWLSVERLKDIVGVLLPYAKRLDFSPEFLEREASEIKLNDIHEDAPYVFAFVYDDEAGREAIETLKKRPDLTVNVHYAHEKWEGFLNVQITDHEANKYHGVQALIKLLKISKDEILAIGDSENDIPLFKAAGMKVAMGNASPELKELADFVVGSVNDDGFSEAMSKFVLKN